MILIRLFYEFFKTGLFSIGGGMAAIPFLYEMSAKTGWFTSEALTNMIAVSESTPGPVGVNMATYVGFTAAGIPGAVIATIGLVMPSVIIIIIIAKFLKNFRNNKYVDAAFYGVRPASSALIAAAAATVIEVSLLNIDLFKQTKSLLNLFNYKTIALAVIIFILTNFVKPTKNLHPVIYILFAAVVGIVFNFAGA